MDEELNELLDDVRHLREVEAKVNHCLTLMTCGVPEIEVDAAYEILGLTRPFLEQSTTNY